MAQKKFQKKTKFSAWDLDNDGEITDEEIKITCREGTVVSISRRQIMEVVVKE